jgi:hypothetical protein
MTSMTTLLPFYLRVCESLHAEGPKPTTRSTPKKMNRTPMHMYILQAPDFFISRSACSASQLIAAVACSTFPSSSSRISYTVGHTSVSSEPGAGRCCIC